MANRWRWVVPMLVLGLLVSFVLGAVNFARHTSPCYDEVCHLPAGYAYLKWDDYRMNPEHPPLVKKIAALPLLTCKVWPDEIALRQSDVANPTVRDSGALLRVAWASRLEAMRNEWIFGHQFFYGLREVSFARLVAQNPTIHSPTEVPTRAELRRADFMHDPDELVFRARLAVLALGVALALVVFCWARELFGLAGGVLALALFCCDPNFIAHSALVTTDVGASLMFCITMYFWWRVLRSEVSPRKLDVLAFAVSFGAAFTVKFSSVLLLPMLALLTAIWWWVRMRPTPRRWQWLRQMVWVGLLTVLVAYFLIWASYSFRYNAVADVGQQRAAEAALHLPGTFRQPGQLPLELILRKGVARRWLTRHAPADLADPAKVDAAVAAVELDWKARLALSVSAHKLLPEAFIYGLASTTAGAAARPSFLRGEISPTGFRGYFFWTTVFKTPLPALILMTLAVAFVIVRPHWFGLPVIFLLVPSGLYLAVSWLTHLNIGQRHLLPVFPFMYVLAGGLVIVWRHWKPSIRGLMAVLVLAAIIIGSRVVFSPQPKLPWRVASPFQRIAPHYLAYFNELAGGPANGHNLLADSNLDWGQELKNLPPLLAAHDVREPIALVYFGMADPRHEILPHYCPPGGYPLCEWTEFTALRPGGILAISATAKAGQFMTPAERVMWKQILAHSTLLDQLGGAMLIYRYDGD